MKELQLTPLQNNMFVQVHFNKALMETYPQQVSHKPLCISCRSMEWQVSCSGCHADPRELRESSHTSVCLSRVQVWRRLLTRECASLKIYPMQRILQFAKLYHCKIHDRGWCEIHRHVQVGPAQCEQTTASKIISNKANFELSMQNSIVEIEMWFPQDLSVEYPCSDKAGPTCRALLSHCAPFKPTLQKEKTLQHGHI